MNRKFLNILCAAAGLVLAAAMFFSAGSFPDRAEAATRYVVFLSGLLACLSLALMAQFAFKDSGGERIRWVVNRRTFLFTVVASVLFVLLLNFVGFFLASGFYMFVLGWILGFRDKMWLLIGTLGLLGFVYIVFVRFLAVPVPAGLWGA
ncbi:MULTISPECIES: tripartite tricarboxylate transporter TctB family protein [Dethiosulfovibrio]|uniref:Tripartite tricarboxylate transporter TctB family protein n=2 Tax=Dethiosulfovibrio TaxID=47054 RepID=A0ABS9EP08_9BACT|nr:MULTISPECIES: tripartite tricarboxylate transporter TctB family protein [Dethiosulfovibrio]MCF4114434.1 tripartite tricarboxylate transporter TctB family protein [Dethiosulfovibrio russensis]MCF4142905.1 tripartite tricarboxylate transporter TctB family protein [Dethiosulfovibrio marinus]MCF4145002.1 tripartite tricarboxylate transporter TctB family protein [Dethiosulfovibrio acidaminovorans]